MRPADLGPPLSLAPFRGSSGTSWAPGTPPPLRPPLIPRPTSPSRPFSRSPPRRQAPHPGGPPRSPPPGHRSRRRRRRRWAPPLQSSGCRSSSCPPGAAAGRPPPRGSPDRGSGPTAAPSEGPESAGEASVVPESPPGPSLQASPSAEDRPAPRQARRRTPQHHTAATDPQLLAIHRRQLEVAEQHLQVEQRRLHLQERELAWRQEAWGAYMETFNRLVDYLAPPCRASRRSAHPAHSTRRATHCSARRCAIRRRPATRHRGPERRRTPGAS
ncbi:uncharacterized protein LOC142018229 [Carettochelys insculpta]|uniref:uncharacterized protein LOC142018229 n=1 Tax=Carettochelys insculpta TaxID=44489 RepID=UPI003EBE5FB7